MPGLADTLFDIVGDKLNVTQFTILVGLTVTTTSSLEPFKLIG